MPDKQPDFTGAPAPAKSGRHAPDVRVLPRAGQQTWRMHSDLAELDLPEQAEGPGGTGGGSPPCKEDVGGAVRLPGLGGVRERIGVWRALLDRPLTSYYLVLGITVLLLVLGLVMVQSTASVADLTAGLSPYSDFKKQLLGACVGLPLMWVAARSSPRLFRALAYPLLAISAVAVSLKTDAKHRLWRSAGVGGRDIGRQSRYNNEPHPHHLPTRGR